MIIPTSSKLKKRDKEARDKLKKMQKAVDDFLAVWGKIEKEQKGLQEELNSYVEKRKMHMVLEKINSIQE